MHPTAPAPLTPALPSGYTAVVLGASGALGQAFVQALQSDARCGRVLGLARRPEGRTPGSPALVLDDEATLAACAAWLAPQGPLHLVVDATGALTLDGRGPEKHLDELDANHLARAFAVNTIGPALALKHLGPLLATQERAIWAKLSARVGSIGDNRKGGWYGYRAAKAALNMVLQTAAIELGRRRPHLVVAALQPGTVRSNLSRPFVGEAGTAPAKAAQALLAVLHQLPAAANAQFVDHRGQTLPW